MAAPLHVEWIRAHRRALRWRRIRAALPYVVAVLSLTASGLVLPPW